jgi:hypothetical protein
MGRYSTGAQTVNAIQRLEISVLKKLGYFDFFKQNIYGYHTQQLSWSNGSVIGIETHHTKEGSFLVLNYTVTDNRTGEKTAMNYKVHIEFKPSNLGKGYVLYFICPVSFRRCRILYRAYGSTYFKAREAYQNRLYYQAQTSSKKYQIIDRFTNVRDKVDAIWESKRRKQTTFKGKPTKFSLKFEALKEKRWKLDEQAESFMIANIYKR